MIENPVLWREWRGRWRRPMTPLIIFAYATVLALIAYYAFDWQSNEKYTSLTSSRLGLDLLVNLSCWQLVVSSFLATTIAASSITTERESGMWTALRLTRLSPLAISLGKFASSVAFTFLLICVPLPIGATFLILGGVSGSEFLLITLLQITTVSLCAAAATAASARAHKSSSAFSFALLCAAAIVPLPLLTLFNLGQDIFTKFALPLIVWGLALIAAFVFGITPICIGLRTKSSAERGISSINGNTSSPTELPQWELAAPAISATSNAGVLARGRSAPSPRTSRHDGPVGRRLRFTNPVLQREIRLYLRRWCEKTEEELLTTFSWSLLLWMLGLWILGTIIYSNSGDTNTQIQCCAPEIIWIIFAAMKTATFAFTRDRNQGMLQPMMMTLLTPGEIIWGKLATALLAAAIPALLSLPLVQQVFVSAPLQTLAGLVTLAAIVWFIACSGLFCSWYCATTAVAMTATSMFLCICIMLLSQLFSPDSALSNYLQRLPSWKVVQPWLQPATPFLQLIVALTVAMVIFLFGCVLLLLVGLALRPSALEKDSASVLTINLSKATQ